MRHIFLAGLLVAACTSAAEHSDQRSATPGQAAGTLSTDTAATATQAGAVAAAAKAASNLPAADVPNTPIRALYVNRWASQSKKRMTKLIGIADSTEINGLVIDMKDEFGLN